jgi:hypothetical protein
VACLYDVARPTPITTAISAGASAASLSLVEMRMQDPRYSMILTAVGRTA